MNPLHSPRHAADDSTLDSTLIVDTTKIGTAKIGTAKNDGNHGGGQIKNEGKPALAGIKPTEEPHGRFHSNHASSLQAPFTDNKNMLTFKIGGAFSEPKDFLITFEEISTLPSERWKPYTRGDFNPLVVFTLLSPEKFEQYLQCIPLNKIPNEFKDDLTKLKALKNTARQLVDPDIEEKCKDAIVMHPFRNETNKDIPWKISIIRALVTQDRMNKAARLLSKETWHDIAKATKKLEEKMLELEPRQQSNIREIQIYVEINKIIDRLTPGDQRCTEVSSQNSISLALPITTLPLLNMTEKYIKLETDNTRRLRTFLEPINRVLNSDEYKALVSTT